MRGLRGLKSLILPCKPSHNRADETLIAAPKVAFGELAICLSAECASIAAKQPVQGVSSNARLVGKFQKKPFLFARLLGTHCLQLPKKQVILGERPCSRSIRPRRVLLVDDSPGFRPHASDALVLAVWRLYPLRCVDGDRAAEAHGDPLAVFPLQLLFDGFDSSLGDIHAERAPIHAMFRRLNYDGARPSVGRPDSERPLFSVMLWLEVCTYKKRALSHSTTPPLSFEYSP